MELEQQTIIEIMESYNQYLTQLSAGVLSISENLRNGEYNNAFQMIKDFSEGINWIYDVSTKLNQLGYENEISLNMVTGFLNEINEGLEIGDFGLVADIFEYEISPFVSQLKPFNS